MALLDVKDSTSTAFLQPEYLTYVELQPEYLTYVVVAVHVTLQYNINGLIKERIIKYMLCSWKLSLEYTDMFRYE